MERNLSLFLNMLKFFNKNWYQIPKRFLIYLYKNLIFNWQLIAHFLIAIFSQLLLPLLWVKW